MAKYFAQTNNKQQQRQQLQQKGATKRGNQKGQHKSLADILTQLAKMLQLLVQSPAYLQSIC